MHILSCFLILFLAGAVPSSAAGRGQPPPDGEGQSFSEGGGQSASDEEDRSAAHSGDRPAAARKNRPGAPKGARSVPPKGASPDAMVGAWKGKFKSTPDNCAWNVKAAAKGKRGVLAGNFSYDGKCADEARLGTFTTEPAEPGCLAVTVEIEGMPEITLMSCMDNKGVATFECPAFKGTVRFSPDGSSCKVVVDGGMGGATGTLNRVSKSSAAGAGKGRKKRATEEKGEVWVGGDTPDEAKPRKIHQSRD